MTNIKPKDHLLPTRKPAAELLNKLLKENRILLDNGRMNASITDEGVILIHKPNIVAVYEDEVAKENIETVN